MCSFWWEIAFGVIHICWKLQVGVTVVLIEVVNIYLGFRGWSVVMWDVTSELDSCQECVLYFRSHILFCCFRFSWNLWGRWFEFVFGFKPVSIWLWKFVWVCGVLWYVGEAKCGCFVVFFVCVDDLVCFLLVIVLHS